MVDSQFAEECLKHHNTLRALHNSPDLVIDIKLNDFAQEWATTIAGKDCLEHREENDFGENIYVGFSADPERTLEAQVPVQSWYDEISAYVFGEPTPENLEAVAHFTQVVWKGSQKLGVGIATNESGKTYVVCNYEPAGNVFAEFPDNVTPDQKDAEDGATTAEGSILDRKSVRSSVSRKTITVVASVASTLKTSSSKTRLDAIPPEELCVWSAWLVKVAETAVCEWEEWLLSHINLALRLNKMLLKAKEEIELAKLRQEKACEELQQQQAKVSSPRPCSPRPCSPRPCRPRPCSATAATFVYPKSDAATGTAKKKCDKKPEISKEQETSGDEETIGEEEEEEGGEKWGNKWEEELEEVWKEEGVGKGEEEGEGEMEEGDEEREEEEEERKEGEEEREEGGEEETEQENDKIIPMPRDESEMLEIIKEFSQRARRYQLLYQYWLKTADRVIEEIAGKSAMSTKQEYSDEEIPYFFYLQEEPDVDIRIENDDEEILRSESGQERITCKNLQLCFNLKDEPDKIENTSQEIQLKTQMT